MAMAILIHICRLLDGSHAVIKSAAGAAPLRPNRPDKTIQQLWIYRGAHRDQLRRGDGQAGNSQANPQLLVGPGRLIEAFGRLR